MKLAVRVLIALYFGLSAGNLPFIMNRDRVLYSNRLEFWSFDVICLVVGVIAAAVAFRYSDSLLNAIGVRGDIKETMQGRVTFVVLILFSCWILYLFLFVDVYDSERWLFAVPLTFAILSIARWVLNGGRENA